MGVSIKLYAVKDSRAIQSETDLEQQLDANDVIAVELDKCYTDLAIVLTNCSDPFDLDEELGYQAVMGISDGENIEIGGREIVGFLNHKQATEVENWLKTLNITTKVSFSDFFDKLDEDVKETLEDYGTEKDDLYEGYFKPLLAFYDSIKENKKGVLFCAE